MNCRGKARPLSALGLVTLLQHIPQTGGAKVHKTTPLRLFSGTRPRAIGWLEGDRAGKLAEEAGPARLCNRSAKMASNPRPMAPAALLLIVMLTLSPTAPAMELKVVGNQIILTGPVLGDEPGKVREALASSAAIDTVILRNSSGGNAPAGYQVGEMIRERGLRTAVSGYCYSSCSRMFLGGRTRYFTDDYPPEYNNVGLHGHYNRLGQLNVDSVRRYGLRDWIIKYSDG